MPVSNAAIALFEILKPLAYKDSQLGNPLLNYSETLAGALQQVADLVDGGDEFLNTATTLGNEITNPSWESGTAAWDTSSAGFWLNGGGTYTRDTTEHNIGSASAKFTGSGIALMGIGYITNFSVVSGQSYTFSAYVKRTSGTGVLRIGIGAGGGVGNTFTDFTPTTVWQRVSVTHTALATAPTAQIAVFNPVNSAQTWFMDNAMYMRGGLTEYVDGDLETGKWEGTPHASRSLRYIPSTQFITKPSWGTILDVDLTPYEALPWLAQFVGADAPKILPGESQAEHDARVRAYIRSTPGFYRGTPAAIMAAAQQYLLGNKTVFFRERDTSAYHLTVNTRYVETPFEDWPSTNNVSNGGFESNTTGWTTNNVTLTRVTDKSHDRLASANLLSTSTADPYAASPSHTLSGATAGRTFTASAWVFAETTMIGKSVTIAIVETGGATATADNGTVYVLAAGWNYIVRTSTLAQNDRTGIHVRIGQRSTAAAQGVDDINVDAVQLEEYAFPTPYIETNGAEINRPSGTGPVGRAIQAQKPGGLVMVLGLVTGWDYAALDAAYASYTALDAAHTTYADVQEGP